MLCIGQTSVIDDGRDEGGRKSMNAPEMVVPEFKPLCVTKRWNVILGSRRLGFWEVVTCCKETVSVPY